MIWIAGVIVLVTLALSVLSILTRKRRKAWDEQKIVHLPFALALIGMFCGCILCVPMVACALQPDPLFYFMAAVCLMCDGMMLGYLNCVVYYDDNGFCSGNLFGIQKEFAYSDIIGVRCGKDIRIHCKGRKILLDEICSGKEDFIETIDKGYHRATGRWVPRIERKRDPMNGNLDYPWLYFVIFTVTMIMGIVIPALYFYGMNVETDPAKISYREVAIVDCEEVDGDLVFYTEDPETTYALSYWEDYNRFWPESQRFHTGKLFRIGTKGENKYIRYMADTDGNIYVEPELERQIYRDNQKSFAVFVWILSPAMLLVGYFGIAIGRDPERYPKAVRRLFYKDSVFVEVK